MHENSPEFAYTVTARGDVIITHRGKKAAVLRSGAAVEFLEDVKVRDPQLLMARMTGNFKRGNERNARDHPRNRLAR